MKHLLSFVPAPLEWIDLCLRSAYPYPDTMFMHVREKKVHKSRINRYEIAPVMSCKLFRFNKEHVELLAETFLPESDETRGGCLSQVGRMEITLHYLTDPGYSLAGPGFISCLALQSTWWYGTGTGPLKARRNCTGHLLPGRFAQ